MPPLVSFLDFLSFSAAFLIILILPGNALLLLLEFKSSSKLSVDLRIPLAIGLGLCLPPIFLLWVTTFGITLHSAFIYSYIAVSLLVNISLLLFDTVSANILKHKPSIKITIWLLGIFTLTWFTRFLAIHGFLVGPGIDSYHHTLISSLIAEQGQIPSSYEPYTLPSSFTYHFGFHTITALMHWITEIPLTKLTLWVGQGLSSLAVLSTYFMAKHLTQSNIVALIASLFVGVVAIFPAYMTNWGRFTQLSGLVILIIAVGLIIKPTANWKINIFLIAGIFLFHYRIFAMLGILVFIVMVFQFNESRQNLFLGLSCGAAFILIVPWLTKLVFVSSLFNMVEEVYTLAIQPNSSISYYSIDRLEIAPTYYSSGGLILLAIVGSIHGLLTHKKITIIIISWMVAMLLASNPHWLPIPGVGLLDVITVAISLFAPICFFAALGVERISLELIGKKPKNIKLRWGTLALLVSLILYVSVRTVQVTPKSKVLVQSTDWQAIEWIKTNTPSEAKFIVSPILFNWNQEGLASTVGSDAGYWLPLLANRQTNTTPIVLDLERKDNQLFKAQVETSQIVINPSMDTLKTLKQQGFTHIFIGSHGTQNNNIHILFFEQNNCVQEVWSRDMTIIFAIDYACIPN